MFECCFTSTEKVGLLETEAQDGHHLGFHTAPELWNLLKSLVTMNRVNYFIMRVHAKNSVSYDTVKKKAEDLKKMKVNGFCLGFPWPLCFRWNNRKYSLPYLDTGNLEASVNQQLEKKRSGFITITNELIALLHTTSTIRPE